MPRPTPRRRKDARPGELLAAALDLFVDKGFAATRLDDVAARAGVSKGTVYLYFPSKEELFKQVVRTGLLPVLEEGAVLLEQHQGPAADLLRALLFGWWERIGATRLAGIPKLMLSEAGNFPELAAFYYDTVIQRGCALLTDVLRRGMKSGEFRAVDADIAADVLIAPLLMLVLWRYSFAACCPRAKIDPATFIGTQIDLLLDGLRTVPAAGARS
jgi:AcrR family transcriptional regulator